MSNLSNLSNNIRITQAEVEMQPGGKKVHVPLKNLEDDKSRANPGQNAPMGKDSLYNLFMAHLLRPKEWTA